MEEGGEKGSCEEGKVAGRGSEEEEAIENGTAKQFPELDRVSGAERKWPAQSRGTARVRVNGLKNGRHARWNTPVCEGLPAVCPGFRSASDTCGRFARSALSENDWVRGV